MRFIKFYLLLLITTSVTDIVNYFFLDKDLSSLVSLLGLITIILGVVAIFKIQKLNLSNTVKLFPVFVIVSTLLIIILTTVFAVDNYELARSGSGIRDAVLTTPYWILILDKTLSVIFVFFAVGILRKLKISQSK